MNIKEKLLVGMYLGGIVISAMTCLAILAGAPKVASATLSFVSFGLLITFTLTILKVIRDESQN